MSRGAGYTMSESNFVCRRRWTGALATAIAAAALSSGCIDRPVEHIVPVTRTAVPIEIQNEAVAQVDLLLEVDNSISMSKNQDNIARQLGLLIETLTNPPDTNGDGRPDYPPVRDLHVGV